MKVAIVMGSDSDFPIIKPGIQLLQKFKISTTVIVASAHRTPERVVKYVKNAEAEGVEIFISVAGAAAHLGGVIAAHTTCPVIGVPVDATALKGMDALLSTVQMPSGVPVATMAINGGKNAAVFALEILALKDEKLKEALISYREEMAKGVEAKSKALEDVVNNL